MRNKFRSTLTLSLLLFSISSFSQPVTGYEGSLSGGYILPHHQEIAYYVKAPVYAGSVRLFRKGFGKKYWHHLYNYPDWGLGLHYSTLGNKQVYGNAYSLYGYYTSGIFRTSQWQVGSRISFGIAYLTQAFNLEDNYKNYAIGSHINIYFKFSLESDWQFSQKNALINSIGFTHYSNGKVTVPNKGLNCLRFTTGIRHYLKKPVYEEQAPETPAFEKNEIAVYGAIGWKEISLLYYPKQFGIASVTADYFRHYSNKGKYGAGFDLFYDQSVKSIARNNGIENPGDFFYYRLGAHLSHAWKVSGLRLFFQAGYYLYSQISLRGNSYTRIGLRYQLFRHLACNLTLKAHKAKADFVEFGIGTNFLF